jgi:hypothetical protein
MNKEIFLTLYHITPRARKTNRYFLPVIPVLLGTFFFSYKTIAGK